MEYAPKPITIKAFQGINTLHTRSLGQLSAGKNCITKGTLKSRRGGSLITGPTGAGPIKSIHGAVQVGAERLLVEEGTNLWHRTTPTGDWSKLKDGTLTGARLSSCRWEDFLILVNGNEMMAYDITLGTIADLGGTPPPMQYVMSHNHILFGWAPDKPEANKIFLCGYVEGTVRRSKDVWDVTELMIDVTGTSGSPVLQVIPCQSHYLAIAKDSFWRIYGSTEFDFNNNYGGKTNLVNSRCAVKAGDYVIWLGQEEGLYKVFRYSGTTPVPISDPVESLFPGYSFANPWAYGGTNDFMLFLPNTATGKTIVMIFDTSENYWQPPHEYPEVFNDVTEFGLYLQRQYVTLGLNDGTIARLDDSATDFGTAITTGFTLGPLNINSQKLSIKNIHHAANPHNAFDINVYSKADLGVEKGPRELSFAQGAVANDKVKFGAFKGQNLTLRYETTDRIDELQAITIILVPKDVK